MRKYGIEHFHIESIEETDIPEEREIYWIEYYRSFKNGYNATMGGDGKKYIDYDLVISTYNQLQNIIQTASHLNIHPDSVSNILHQNNINIKSSQEINREQTSKITLMFDKNNNFIRSFPSSIAAAQYLIDNNLTNCKLTTIRTHISEVCRGKRKTAAGFIWRFNN